MWASGADGRNNDGRKKQCTHTAVGGHASCLMPYAERDKNTISNRYTVGDMTQDNTTPGPFSKLDCFTARRMPVPRRVLLERSRRQLAENVSFGTGIVLGAEQPGFENRPRGCVILCHLRYTHTCYMHCCPEIEKSAPRLEAPKNVEKKKKSAADGADLQKMRFSLARYGTVRCGAVRKRDTTERKKKKKRETHPARVKRRAPTSTSNGTAATCRAISSPPPSGLRCVCPSSGGTRRDMASLSAPSAQCTDATQSISHLLISTCFGVLVYWSVPQTMTHSNQEPTSRCGRGKTCQTATRSQRLTSRGGLFQNRATVARASTAMKAHGFTYFFALACLALSTSVVYH